MKHFNKNFTVFGYLSGYLKNANKLMNKIIFTAAGIFFTMLSFSQRIENLKLIELSKSYKGFKLNNVPQKDFIENLQSTAPDNLKKATDFIIQTISTDNKLLTPQYLSLPDKKTLMFIGIINAINQNSEKENQVNENELIDTLRKKGISMNELVDNYYNLLFTAVGNKIKPFDLSKTDFKLNDYNLTTDSYKGIFFLQCMKLCNIEIWGYMNIVKPANTKKAYDYIKRFPKINGTPYYQFMDFDFPDFNVYINESDGMQSYKNYYINKYYDLLLSHITSLNKEGASEEDINGLLVGSVLKDKNLYKYSKNKETLEKLFTGIKQ